MERKILTMQEKEGEQYWWSDTFMRDFSARSRDCSSRATEEKIEYLGTDGGRWVNVVEVYFLQMLCFLSEIESKDIRRERGWGKRY